jgi:hypothetical protein
MLNTINEPFMTQAQSALALLAAEHVVPLFAPRSKLRAALEDMLRDDWSWLETRAPDPGQIYWTYMPYLMEEDSRMPKVDPLLPVLHCCLYAQMYFIWNAEGATRIEEPEKVQSIGNDIAEVDESFLTQCLEYAVRVSPQPEVTTDWLNGLIARVERELKVTPPDYIGPRLSRAMFTVPPIIG